MTSYDDKEKNGRKGGKKTLKTHGIGHFAKIGRKGARLRWKKVKAAKAAAEQK